MVRVGHLASDATSGQESFIYERVRTTHHPPLFASSSARPGYHEARSSTSSVSPPCVILFWQRHKIAEARDCKKLTGTCGSSPSPIFFVFREPFLSTPMDVGQDPEERDGQMASPCPLEHAHNSQCIGCVCGSHATRSENVLAERGRC
jgi:hypothetical protein